jgi:hypothetical protein
MSKGREELSDSLHQYLADMEIRFQNPTCKQHFIIYISVFIKQEHNQTPNNFMTGSFRSLLLISLAYVLMECSKQTVKNEASSTGLDSTAVEYPAQETDVTGDFDGDGKSEKVLVRLINDANMNPEEPWSYAFEFSNSKLPPIEISPMMADGCYVLNEGNIDGQAGDELSVIVCDINKTASLSLYKFKGNDWETISEGIDIVCGLPETIDPQDLVVKADSGIYALEFEMISYDSNTYQKKELILASGSGDFNGDGNREMVFVKTVHDPSLDDFGHWEYSIYFSDSTVPPLVIQNSESPGCTIESKTKQGGKPSNSIEVTTIKMMNKMLVEQYQLKGKNWVKLNSETVDR